MSCSVDVDTGCRWELESWKRTDVKYATINNQRGLEAFCDRISAEPWIGFDTEFVSEDRYRPQLCLLQVAAGDHLAIIDPFKTQNTMPFWDLISTPGRTVLAHAAREEIRFCYRFTGKPIAGLFDIQLAAAFIGLEYPASLGTLTQRLLGKTLAKGESRTNWRDRPLSQHQLKYAIQDVTELRAMQSTLVQRIQELGRIEWLAEETEALQRAVIHSEGQQNWRRVSGMNRLTPRQMEIVRQIWFWREARAELLDRPSKHVLRDDLVVELARRETSDVERIRSVRGMERRNLAPFYHEIAGAIRTALQTDDADLPHRTRHKSISFSNILSQFLSLSIGCICRQNQIAPSIVGNMDEVRQLLVHELSPTDSEELPALLRGWRSEVIGKSFRHLLAGELAIRVVDRESDEPLEFIEVPRGSW